MTDAVVLLGRLGFRRVLELRLGLGLVPPRPRLLVLRVLPPPLLLQVRLHDPPLLDQHAGMRSDDPLFNKKNIVLKPKMFGELNNGLKM